MDNENKANPSGYEIEDVGQVQIADEVCRRCPAILPMRSSASWG